MQDTASHLQKNKYQKEKIRNNNVVGKGRKVKKKKEKKERKGERYRRVRMRIRTKEKMDSIGKFQKGNG